MALINKELKYGNTTISVHLMRPLKAARITKILVQLIGTGTKGDTSKKHIMTAIADGLQSMEEKAFEEFLIYIYSGCQVMKPKVAAFTIEDSDTFDMAFEGVDLENIFVGIFEILKFNRFPLLREVEVNIGELIQEIGLSLKADPLVMNTETPTESQES